METQLQAIAAAALARMEPELAKSEEATTTVTLAATDRVVEGSIEARRKGTGFMKRGAPEPGTPVHSLSILGLMAAGVAHPDPLGFMVDINDPTTGPQLEMVSAWTLAGDDMMPLDATLDQIAPHVLELIASPSA